MARIQVRRRPLARGIPPPLAPLVLMVSLAPLPPAPTLGPEASTTPDPRAPVISTRDILSTGPRLEPPRTTMAPRRVHPDTPLVPVQPLDLLLPTLDPMDLQAPDLRDRLLTEPWATPPRDHRPGLLSPVPVVHLVVHQEALL